MSKMAKAVMKGFWFLVLASLLPAGAGCATTYHRVRTPMTDLEQEDPDPAWQGATQPDWPATQPTTRPALAVTPMALATWHGEWVLTASMVTAPVREQHDIERLRRELLHASAGAHVPLLGSMTIIFHGRVNELAAPFTMDVGVAVPAGTHGVGRFNVRYNDEFRCAAVTCTGPAAFVDKGYDVLEPAIDAAGLKRSGETREVYSSFGGGGEERFSLGEGVK